MVSGAGLLNEQLAKGEIRQLLTSTAWVFALGK